MFNITIASIHVKTLYKATGILAFIQDGILVALLCLYYILKAIPLKAYYQSLVIPLCKDRVS